MGVVRSASWVFLAAWEQGSQPGRGFAPRGHLTMSGDVLGCHTGREMVLLASSGRKSGMLLSISQGTGWAQDGHRTNCDPVPDVDRAKVRSPAGERRIRESLAGIIPAPGSLWPHSARCVEPALLVRLRLVPLSRNSARRSFFLAHNAKEMKLTLQRKHHWKGPPPEPLTKEAFTRERAWPPLLCPLSPCACTPGDY